ncbi:hypothetical protein KY284_007778 [Solanum tuberosum]|nr:hypothetical protein KY284_007778 [Solanum tuberosum]
MSRYILAMESGNSKMKQLFDTMSDKACKVFNVMCTSLLVRVLAETPKETGTIQQFHFKDKACLLISFGGQESIVSAAHSTHALPRRYFDVNSLYSVLSRQKIDLVASNNIYVDIIFMKSTILEDVSKREIQSNDVRNDVKHVKFNEGIRHDECLFPVDPGENLFMVKLGGTVKDNGWQVLVDVCALGAKNMPTLSVQPSSQIEPLGAWGDKNLTVEGIMEHQNVSKDQCAYWCLRMIYICTDEISFWVDTIVCPMNNINCMRAFECISVTGIVTCKWFKVVQPIEVVQGYNDNLLLPETIRAERAISIVIALNLEDKVLIEERSIVMNQPRPNINIYTNVAQLVIGPRRCNITERPSQRLIWVQGPSNK